MLQQRLRTWVGRRRSGGSDAIEPRREKPDKRRGPERSRKNRTLKKKRRSSRAARTKEVILLEGLPKTRSPPRVPGGGKTGKPGETGETGDRGTFSYVDDRARTQHSSGR